MSCRPMNKSFILPPHSMETAMSLNFKPIGNTTFFWDRRTLLWNWSLSRVVVSKLTIPKIFKRRTKKRQKRMRKLRRTRLVPLVNHANSIFAFDVFQCWIVPNSKGLCTQVLPLQQLQGSYLRIQGSFAMRGVRLWKIWRRLWSLHSMRKSLTFPKTSRGQSPTTRRFCNARGTTMKNFQVNYRSAFVWTFFQKQNETALQTRW